MFVRARVEVRADNTGGVTRFPCIVTPSGPLMPLLDYFISKSALSPSWRDSVVRSVRRFLYYMAANPAESNTRFLFTNFAKALEQGSFNLDTSEDPSGLCWPPSSGDTSAAIITDLSQFFDFLGEKNPKAADINPMVPVGEYDRRWNEAARTYRRDRDLLGHLWSDPSSDNQGRRFRGSRDPSPTSGKRPAFPEDRFEELLVKGFKVGNRIDHRNICITLLMHGGGFRASEPFHMYVDDAQPNPNARETALVAIHHPSAGYAPAEWRDPLTGKRGLRKAYLAAEFGLEPRHKLLDSRRAGWKGGRYDQDNYKRAYWFDAGYGEMFLFHWNRYLEQLVHVKRNHPFLFVNLERGELGDMYKLGTFNDAHAAACERIGLRPLKELGTTPHGHRHAYGQRVRKAGLDQKVRQILLHHKNITSQDVYTEPDMDEVIDALQKADEKMRRTIEAT